MGTRMWIRKENFPSKPTSGTRRTGRAWSGSCGSTGSRSSVDDMTERISNIGLLQDYVERMGIAIRPAAVLAGEAMNRAATTVRDAEIRPVFRLPSQSPEAAAMEQVIYSAVSRIREAQIRAEALDAAESPS